MYSWRWPWRGSMLFIVGDTYPFMAYIDLLLPHAFDSSVDSLSQSNCIPLSHPPAPVKRKSGTEEGVIFLGQILRMYLASYSTPGHVAIDMGVFPSAGVREYVVCLFRPLFDRPWCRDGPITHTQTLHYVDHEVAKTIHTCSVGRYSAVEMPRNTTNSRQTASSSQAPKVSSGQARTASSDQAPTSGASRSPPRTLIAPLSPITPHLYSFALLQLCFYSSAPPALHLQLLSLWLIATTF